MKHSASSLVFATLLGFAYPVYCATPRAAKDVVRRVGVLIKRMLNARTERKAFSDFELLGCPAVPAIIRRMDDRPVLPDPRISLRNKSPQAFEAVCHYGPVQVVDALAATLNQLTGQDFGFIYNGGTDEERSRTVQGWRKFLDTAQATKVCEAG